MELSIPAYSLKDFTAVLKCFKSFSDHLHIHPHQSRLKLSAVSATRSTYAVAICEQAYFESYVLSNPALGLIEVAVKPLYKIFAHQNLLSAIESCNILIDADEPVAASRATPAHSKPAPKHRLTIKLKLAVGIVRSFSLPYASSRTLNPTDLRAENSPNRWICLATNLKQWLDHFVSNPNITQNLVGSAEGVEEICFCYQNDGKVVLRTVNLADETDPNVVLPKNTDIFSKGVRQISTVLTITSSEFEEYHVEIPDSTAITTTVSMKEVRSILELGSVLGSALDVGFSVGGRPVYLSIANEEGSVGMEFVLASTDGEEVGAAGPAPAAAARQPRADARREGVDTHNSSRVESLAPSAAAPRAPQTLFRPEDEEEDELDRMPLEEWARVEQEAIALSQTRNRSVAARSAPPEDDDDDQLLPSDDTPDRQLPQARWKLFDD